MIGYRFLLPAEEEMTDASVFHYHDWKFGVGGAALSLAPAVYNAFRGSTIELQNQPLAYAAFGRGQTKGLRLLAESVGT